MFFAFSVYTVGSLSSVIKATIYGKRVVVLSPNEQSWVYYRGSSIVGNVGKYDDFDEMSGGSEIYS